MGVVIKKAIEHYDFLHNDQKDNSTALVWRKNSPKWHKFDNVYFQQDFFDEIDLETDVFLTPNEFFGWRRFDLLKNLRSCFVDIDKQLDRNELNELIDNSNMPKPSAIVFSGRGWHLYWLIEKTPSNVLPVWQEMQDVLINAFNSDRSARDCARVLRLVGSVNSKNNQQVFGEILDFAPWKFHDLANEILGYRKKIEKKSAKIIDINIKRADLQQKTVKVSSNKSSIYAWWYLVYKDLLTIANSYKNGIPVGDRNNFLFLASVAMSWFANPDSIENALLDKSNAWANGLTNDEVRDACKCSLDRLKMHQNGQKITWQGKEVDPRYFFKRTTLFSKLKHLIKDDVKDQLRAIIDDNTRSTRRSNRDKNRDRVVEGRYSRSYENLNNSKPWEKEEISRATWYRRKNNNN